MAQHKESACNVVDVGLTPEIPWIRKWQPTAIFLPGKSNGQRSLAGYSPRSCKGVAHELETKQQQ